MIKIVTIVGARPQFVKASVLSRIFKASPDINEILVHTGQHYDAAMSDIFFNELGAPAPDYNLGISGGNHGVMTGQMMQRIEETLLVEKPDWVLVYGDTNSTLAGALVASKLLIPIIHVEAGLRSYNRAMPEEVNRVLTDHVSELLFTSTYVANENLKKEGIHQGVLHVGDIMYDASLYALKRMPDFNVLKEKHGIDEEKYSLATIHRVENTSSKSQLGLILSLIKQKANEHQVLMPLHPRTQDAIARFNLDLGNIKVCEPVGYLEMTALIKGSSNVITDSGGLQKEAYFHRKRCLTMRKETEWTETIENGWNRLYTTKSYKELREFDDYGDGTTAQKILNLIIKYS